MAGPTNIPISQIVDVDITLVGAAVEVANFNTLLLVGSEITGQDPVIPQVERVRQYLSQSQVVADFGNFDQVTLASQVWFSQNPRPEDLLITLRYGTAGSSAPSGGSQIIGEPSTFTLLQWQAVLDGSFQFIYNSTVITISNMDFSGVSVVDDVVTIIQDHLNDVNPANLNVNLTTIDGTDIPDENWLGLIAPTGELIINRDTKSGDFYLTTNDVTKDFVSAGAAAFGTDISVKNFLGLSAGRTIISTVLAAFSSNDSDSILDGTDLIALQALTDGGFKATFNTVDFEIDNMDFTDINDLFEIGPIVSARMSTVLGFSVNVQLPNATGIGLLVQSPVQDLTLMTVAAPASGTDISTIIFGAITLTAAGTYLETPPEAIAAATEINDNWFATAITKETIASVAVEISFANIKATASFIQAQSKMYFARLDDATIASSSTTDNGSVLADNNFTRTVPMFTALDEYLDPGAAAKLLTTLPGSSTLKFKTVSGVTASALTANSQQFVLNKNVNLQSVVGSITIIREGTVSSTTAEFADTIRFIDFLVNLIETNVFSIIAAASKIPYTDSGVNQLKQGVEQALNQGVLNGGIASEVDPVTGELISAFTITAQRVADVPLAQRANRISPDIFFTARLAGAIHFVTVRGTVTV